MHDFYDDDGTEDEKEDFSIAFWWSQCSWYHRFWYWISRYNSVARDEKFMRSKRTRKNR